MKHPNKRYKALLAKKPPFMTHCTSTKTPCSFGTRYRGRVDRLSASGPSMESTDKRTIRSLQDLKKNDILVNILQFVDSKSYWCSTAPWVATRRFHFSIPSTVNADINMHNCFTMYPIRPGILERPNKYCKLEVLVGRKIDYKLTGSLQNAVSIEV